MRAPIACLFLLTAPVSAAEWNRSYDPAYVGKVHAALRAPLVLDVVCAGGVIGGCSGAGGGLTSPVSGDFVATGKWTFGSAADAADSVRLGETAGCIIGEGTTADGSETSICFGEATADDGLTVTATSAGVTLSATTGVLTTGKQFRITDGSVTEPSIVFTDDDDATGTGFYSSAANVVDVAINGVQAVSIGSSSGQTQLAASTATAGGFSQYRVNGNGGTNTTFDFKMGGTSLGGTNFGFSGSQSAAILAGGANLTSLVLGTSTDDPVVFGVKNLGRQIHQIKKTLTDNTIATFATFTLGDDTGGGGTVHYCVYANDATTATLECGSIDYAGTDVTAGAGGEVCTTPTKVGTPLVSVNGAVTMTVTFAASTGTDLCNLRVTADTTIVTPTLVEITITAHNSGQAYAPQ